MTFDETSVVIDEPAIDAIFAELDQSHRPGAAVGIALGGRPVYRKGFGLANMELPVTFSPSMRMRIASVTKHFTCLAYLLLCEEGKARIDEPIGTYMPELNGASRIPNVLQLMGHVSGLRDGCDWFFHDVTRRISSSTILQFYRGLTDVNAPAGSSWRYNDGAYVLLGLIIEQIAERPLEHVLRERVFEPVGMKDTEFCRWDTAFRPNIASPHMTTPTAGCFEKAPQFDEALGQGGIISTVDDLLLWLRHMDSPVVGTASSWEQMRTPLKLSNGTSTGYGLGLIKGHYKGLETLSHSGWVPGAATQMLKLPAAGLDIVIMANRQDMVSVDLANKILAACLPLAGSSAGISTAEDIGPVIGIFESASSAYVVKLFLEGQQQVASINGTKVLFEFENDTELVASGVSSYRKYRLFLNGVAGTVSSILFSDFGHEEELYLAHPPLYPESESLAGVYRSTSSGLSAVISSEGGKWVVNFEGPFGRTTYGLEALTDRAWQAIPCRPLSLSGVLVFDADLRCFRLTTSATRSLAFNRVLQ